MKLKKDDKMYIGTNLPPNYTKPYHSNYVINYPDGSKYYYNKMGQLHRDNGPAIEYANGHKSWYSLGVLIHTTIESTATVAT